VDTGRSSECSTSNSDSQIYVGTRGKGSLNKMNAYKFVKI
jgi:hypothetical protein